MTETLFDGRYDARKVRFLLGHFAALEGLVEWPTYARDAMEDLLREWDLLFREARYDHLDCLCTHLNDGIRSAGRFAGTARQGPSVPAGIGTYADLVRGVAVLPLPWRATRHVYEIIGSWEEAEGSGTKRHRWLETHAARLAQMRALGLPRPQDRRIEPQGDPAEPDPLRTGGGAECVRLMVLALRPPRSLDVPIAGPRVA